MNGRKKVILSGLILLLLITMFTCFYNFPNKIDLSYPAVECNKTQTLPFQNTTVVVKGIYYKPLFKNPYFEGKIYISSYSITKSYSLSNIEFYKDLGNIGYLVYTSENNGNSVLVQLGTIQIQSAFKKILINITDPAYGKNSLFIGAPANTYDDAIKIKNSF